MIALRSIYRRLAQTYGAQHWWPITTVDGRRLPPPARMTERAAFEIAVGAILTQNTSWTNAEKALINLKRSRLLSARALSTAPARRIASLIYPSGYFRQKTKKLRAFSRWVVAKKGLRRWAQGRPLFTLRSELLSLHGIGPETADSILLYACGKPVFVIDAYTKRLCGQHGIQFQSYDAYQRFFEERLPRSVPLFQEFHALIVRWGKQQKTGRSLVRG